MMTKLFQPDLKAVLHYNPLTGIFTRIGGRHCPAHLVGKAANYVGILGYVIINVNGKKYRAHRLAWLYMTGGWPADMVDHIDGDKANNQWGNLREADMALNQQNQKRAHVDSKTGVLGVTKTSSGRFKAQISQYKRLRYLGTFDTAVDAALARTVACTTGGAA